MKSKLIMGIVLTALLIGTLMLASDIQQARAVGGWNITTVDSESWLEGVTSIAVDSVDNPHISYGDSNLCCLKYAYYDGVNWNITTVDSAGDVGLYTSIAVDSEDNPHISYYYDWPNYDLKYAYYDGMGWHITTVESEHTVGMYTSIAVDSGDNPHISYREEAWYFLKYAYYEAPTPPPVGGIWVPVDKLSLLAPYIALASTILVATAATAIYVKHAKRRKKKQ